jgi:uncharacterized protein
MPGVIDADTHIIEPGAMWDEFPAELYDRRPVLLKAPSDTLYRAFNAFWLIDGNIVPKSAGKGSAFLSSPSAMDAQVVRTDIELPVRECTDPTLRIRDLDERGAEVEVIYSTLFGSNLTADPELDTALCWAYNRFMARVWKEGKGRLRWTAVLPLTSIDASIEQTHYSKENGAVGVYVRGVEGNHSLAEPYFFPLYQVANDIDFPICIHTGAGSPTISSVFDVRISHTLPHSRMLPLMAFRDILANRVPERFPNLKWGFIESGASWVPYLIHQLRRSTNVMQGRDGPALFRDNNLWIACEADEDLSMLLQYIDEDHVFIGSDYGHQDQSFEDNMTRKMRARSDVPTSVIEKILCTNARAFYPL